MQSVFYRIIIQLFIKDLMIAFLDINDIITSDHHGLDKGHSTNLALASTHHTINDHY